MLEQSIDTNIIPEVQRAAQYDLLPMPKLRAIDHIELFSAPRENLGLLIVQVLNNCFTCITYFRF